MPPWAFLSPRSPSLFEYTSDRSSSLRGQLSPPRRLSFSYFGSLRKSPAEDCPVDSLLSDIGAQAPETRPHTIISEAAIYNASDNKDALTCTHRQLRYLFFRPHVQKLCKRCRALLVISSEERAVYDQLLSAIEQDRGGAASSTLASQAYIEAKRIVREEINATIKIHARIKRSKGNEPMEPEIIIKRKAITLKKDRKGKTPLTVYGHSDKHSWKTMASNSNKATARPRRLTRRAASKVQKSTNRKTKPIQLLRQTKIKTETVTTGLAAETLPDVYKAGVKVRKLRRKESSIIDGKGKTSTWDFLQYRSTRKEPYLGERV
ncbi:hypothetical protein V1525DRAFT_415349 [Lipomyces kononenkoae]|uniref:Uncharacterized protein n=1 Tax=Lipomyces kononenkoae TaxID=34357 RepID=A0ACC3SQ47_LIPKO